MRDESDERLDAFIVDAAQAWGHLRVAVWGAHWDHSRRCLDFSRASLIRLAAWMQAAPEEIDPVRFLRAAVQYFGETVQAHAEAGWARTPTGEIGLWVRRRDWSLTWVSQESVMEAWFAAVMGESGPVAQAFVRPFDALLADALSRPSAINS